ncbi:MAG: TIGR01212 family radical SAM protein [Clostridiales bacterium]|nr:TIGR01212 family radical SAM protein [Clostridiales bacterium]
MVYYTSLNEHLRKAYGCKVYKLSLSTPCTCPNRDGKISTGGCIFCSQGGSGEFASKSYLSIPEQIAYAKKKVAFKNKSGKYIAYFSNFTNTYGDINVLKKLFYEAIAPEEVVAISIATRPDCLGDDVLKLLSDLNAVKPVWCELGLQTTKNESVKYIRRGYENEVYDTAVRNLKAIGVEVITHVILGLPGENLSDMLNTVKHACNMGTNGIKLQLLHVLKGTDLARDFEKGKFKTLELEEYISILEECVKIIPPDVVIHRLTGDGAKSILIAPLWSADKKYVLSKIRERIAPRKFE